MFDNFSVFGGGDGWIEMGSAFSGVFVTRLREFLTGGVLARVSAAAVDGAVADIMHKIRNFFHIERLKAENLELKLSCWLWLIVESVGT